MQRCERRCRQSEVQGCAQSTQVLCGRCSTVHERGLCIIPDDNSDAEKFVAAMRLILKIPLLELTDPGALLPDPFL